MPRSSDAAQTITPELLAWLAAQRASGLADEALLTALGAAGWSSAVAAEALLRGRLVDPATAQSHSGHGPRVAVDDTGTMVDAGDRWVKVLRRVEKPELWEFAGLLSPAECEALVAAARPRMARSRTVDTQTGGEALNRDRTSQGMFFTRGEDALILRIEARIAKLLGWPVQNGEGLQVLRYAPGAQYRPHHDYFDPAEPGTPSILKRGGQRVGTLLMYLQAPEAGGDTVFPDIGLSIPPQRGHAVFFSYPQPDPASLSLHGGAPVTAGEKWVATKWLREREFI